MDGQISFCAFVHGVALVHWIRSIYEDNKHIAATGDERKPCSIFRLLVLSSQYSGDDDDMTKISRSLLVVPPLLIALLLLGPHLPPSDALTPKQGVKSKTFLSPPILLRPGDVADKFYYDIPFPRGHLALKSFNGEVVDERGAPVPLHETYLHHWVVQPYYALVVSAEGGSSRPRTIPARNAGVCSGHTLGQYYGLGSETRRTATWVPDPYGIEIGDPAAAPAEGYEQRWLLNVHAIDTRGAADRTMACTECRCDVYNVTADWRGHAIEPGYAGGLRCCYDGTRCGAAAEGAEGKARTVFLRYTVMWRDWSPAAVLPVRIYIFDVAGCGVEYDVEEQCSGGAGGECVHVKTATQRCRGAATWCSAWRTSTRAAPARRCTAPTAACCASPRPRTGAGGRPGTRRATSSACPRATRARAPSRCATASRSPSCPGTAATAATRASWASSISSWPTTLGSCRSRRACASASRSNGAYRHGCRATCEIFVAVESC